MEKDIPLAFDHLDARAQAASNSNFADRISLRDHICEVEIGAFQAERGNTQRLRFDVVVEVQAAPAPLQDDVDRILSYDTITEAIAHELADARLNLLETLAENVAARILLEPQARRVFIRIEKLDRGPGALGVEIVRNRAGRVQGADHDTLLNPLVVYLENVAVHSDKLGEWIDRLIAQEAPVILCVGLPDGPTPQTGHAPAQRRIDLLEIEQNAWILASRDKRCVVVDSRTELDWAMGQGKLSVWAPSKIVLDAVDSPTMAGQDGLELAKWLAAQMDAVHLIVIGGDDAADGVYSHTAPEAF